MVCSCPLSKERNVLELDEYAWKPFAPRSSALNGEHQKLEAGTGLRCPWTWQAEKHSAPQPPTKHP